jgi:hypothetical protein
MPSALLCFVLAELGKTECCAHCVPAGPQVRSARGGADLAAEFNEQLWIPVMVPTMTHRIELSLWDNNAVGKDSVIANAYLSFQDLQVGSIVPFCS